MRIAEMHWQQVEAQAARDDRAILPIGSTEQHAYLSLCVDAILAEKVAVESADPLGLPVFPVLNYGLTPSFVDYPGTVTLKLSTLIAVLSDVLDGMRSSGFKRIVIVNGHGGNSPALAAVQEWLDRNRGCQVKWHNWWNAPQTFATVQSIDLDLARFSQLDPGAKKKLLGDGNYGGLYQRPDVDMEAIWHTAITETRAVMDDGWA
jgi:creatinine amidohydrolase